jgi:hypothetical protein
LQSSIGKRYLVHFPLRPQLSNTSLAELKLGFVPPTPYTGTGKRNAYLNDSNKAYLSYRHIKSYVSSLSNSSLTDFLHVTITPYLKQQAEVVIGQTKNNQEVEMEAREVEEEADYLHAVPIIAGKSIRALLDTGCLVGDCI